MGARCCSNARLGICTNRNPLQIDVETQKSPRIKSSSPYSKRLVLKNSPVASPKTPSSPKVFCIIRSEETSDFQGVAELYGRNSSQIHQLRYLKESGKIIVSQVALVRGKLIGHICFYEKELRGKSRRYAPEKVFVLGPSTIYNSRHKGVNENLAQSALEKCRTISNGKYRLLREDNVEIDEKLFPLLGVGTYGDKAKSPKAPGHRERSKRTRRRRSVDLPSNGRGRASSKSSTSSRRNSPYPTRSRRSSHSSRSSEVRKSEKSSTSKSRDPSSFPRRESSNTSYSSEGRYDYPSPYPRQSNLTSYSSEIDLRRLVEF